MGIEHRHRAPSSSPVPAELPVAAFGAWPSPFAAAAVAAGKASLGGLHVDGHVAYWLQSRPEDGGRQVLMAAAIETAGAATGAPWEASPPGCSIRSRVHEYGGGAAVVSGGVLYYSDQADQRLYRWPVPAVPAANGGDAGSVPSRAGEPVGAVPAEGDKPVGTVPRQGDAPPSGPAPVPLTPAPPSPGSHRYADGRVTPDGRWFVAVEERHEDGATRHALVAVDAGGSLRVVPLVEQGDFLAAPRPSPDGRLLAWVSWDHPRMPWDGSELWVGRLVEEEGTLRVVEPHRVAGGPAMSVGQPAWCADGSLRFVSDQTGWWQPYRAALGPAGFEAVPLADVAAEFHNPDWVFGQATMAELPDGSLVCRARQDGIDRLVHLPPGTGTGGPWRGALEDLVQVAQPCVTIAAVASALGGDQVLVLGATPTEPAAVLAVPVPASSPAPDNHRGRTTRAVPGASTAPKRSGGPVGPPPRILSAPGPARHLGDVVPAEPFTVAGPAGPVHGLVYWPANRRVAAPPGARPPLVVFCHGGPTAAVEAGFDPVVQFFATRGLAVAAVDYRGSTGYGRAYREQLHGLWGVADVDDCVAAAVRFAERGLVDGARMAVRGTSSGGLTALGALVRSDVFAAGVAWYGVTDLEALAADTHDFESRYMDALVGPLPGARSVYRDRSPVHHPDRVSGAVLLLQGLDDPVVPATQSEAFAAALRAAGARCDYVGFPGESHGFRSAETLRRCLVAELQFYGSTLGFDPAVDDDA